MSHSIEAAFLPGLGPVLRIDALTHQLTADQAEALSLDLHIAALQARLAERQAADRALLASARARARPAGDRSTATEIATHGN